MRSHITCNTSVHDTVNGDVITEVAIGMVVAITTNSLLLYQLL